ncbi:DUF3052 domain-containing protein [Nocardioides mangrovi]|uniref:DUF3052 domain-containing protein n=1 Tax=Nocardioides mangrovi TaxID=2874580 RepID=A0ABS7U9N6_9ACTN|nr:DUF3052 domain-containing protein [Nocardioides mangrovi]MBZ5737695.1 DUF3052 domain-containing protein [Nocardioides mangrovi]
MAGYSGTPLLTKLGIKDEHVVLLDRAPDGFGLGEAGARVVRRLPGPGRNLDVTLTFHTTRASLAARLPQLLDRTATAGMVWMCWPKKAAQKALGIASDLDDGYVRELGLELGWVDVKVAAVDDTWSGLKFVRRLRDR